MCPSFGIEHPVPSEKFFGRSKIIESVCGRLDDPERSSTGLVGGPNTGRTSLLRYMASEHATARYPSLAKSQNIYFAGETVGTTMKPAQFWVGCIREISSHLKIDRLKDVLKDSLEKAKNGTIDCYDLGDMFDAFAKENLPVVIFIDDFHILLKNKEFWPPSDFSHNLRGLCQRHPRGLSVVVATPRPIQDLWDSRWGSPFYNIFANVAIGRLEEQEIRHMVQLEFQGKGIVLDKDIEDLVVTAAERHPFLVNYLTSLCMTRRAASMPIDEDFLRESFERADGPVVTLIREIQGELTPSERQWMSGTDQIKPSQKEILRRLWDYGLIPPGSNIQ